MASVRAWRLATLAGIPAVALLIQSKCAPMFTPQERGHSFRDDVALAVRRTRQGTGMAAWLDSVARSRSRVELGGGASLVVAGRSSPRVVEQLGSQVSRELARLPVRDSSAAVTVVVNRLPWDPYRYGAAASNGWTPCVYSAGDAELARADSLNLLIPLLLGQCAFAAMHGAPGRGVKDWIAQVGQRSRRPAFGRSWANSLDSAGRWVTDASEIQQSWDFWNGRGLRLLGCRDGDQAACRAILDDEWMGHVRGALMWSLAMARPEDFRRFWKADARYEDAAQAALGSPLSVLLSDFLRERYVITGSGPQLPSQAPLAIASVLVVTTLLTILAAKYRYE